MADAAEAGLVLDIAQAQHRPADKVVAPSPEAAVRSEDKPVSIAQTDDRGAVADGQFWLALAKETVCQEHDQGDNAYAQQDARTGDNRCFEFCPGHTFGAGSLPVVVRVKAAGLPLNLAATAGGASGKPTR